MKQADAVEIVLLWRCEMAKRAAKPVPVTYTDSGPLRACPLGVSSKVLCFMTDSQKTRMLNEMRLQGRPVRLRQRRQSLVLIININRSL